MRRLFVVLLLATALTGVGPSSSPAADCPSPAPGQIVACGGGFWQDGNPVLLHGLNTGGIGQDLDMTDEDYAQIAAWHMNVVRMRVGWAQFEPVPPVDNGNGTWTHDYRTGLVPALVDQIAMARAHGIAVLVENRCFCGSGWPDWVAQAAYNSHHRDYDLENFDDRETFMANFWSDDLLKQFTKEWFTSLVSWIGDQAGIVGYEPLDEPGRGNLEAVHDTTQMIMDWQLELAGEVRALDPDRVIFFTTRESSGSGILKADLSGWVNLGNTAFDVHDFFGARWGGGLDVSGDPASPGYGETAEQLFNFTLPVTVPPYLGTTDDQARFLETFTTKLAPTGIPLFVGEFAGNTEGPPRDPDILALFGTMTQAMNLEGISWAALSYDGYHSVFNEDGSLRPWASILCHAAAYPNMVTDCPEPG